MNPPMPDSICKEEMQNATIEMMSLLNISQMLKEEKLRN